MNRSPSLNQDFKCIHCHYHVSAVPAFSGVQNRNHCPYCLWSKHLDLHRAGDRLAACKAQMQPVGLALKKVHKKYGQNQQGELMLVHMCTGCGKISINRIAADDDPDRILEVFNRSTRLDQATREKIWNGDVEMVDSFNLDIIHSQLFGRIHSQAAWSAYRSEALAE